MRKELRHLIIALLTFTIGVVAAFSYRDHQAQRNELMWRESRLYCDLFHMRRSIDEYTADKGELPQSLDDLVKAGYLQEVPYDPFTNRRVWKVVAASDPNSLKGTHGIVDVHSTALIISSQGTPYNQW
jgi:general secretion pathway protein G